MQVLDSLLDHYFIAGSQEVERCLNIVSKSHWGTGRSPFILDSIHVEYAEPEDDEDRQ